jgi:hypothetical protein
VHFQALSQPHAGEAQSLEHQCNRLLAVLPGSGQELPVEMPATPPDLTVRW